MLIHQDTSPFGLASTFRFSWRLVIQDFFEARHVAKLAGRADTWQTGNCGQPAAYPGLTPVLPCFNQPTSMFFSNSKEGPLRMLKRSLSIAHIMENGDMYAPQGSSYNRTVN